VRPRRPIRTVALVTVTLLAALLSAFWLRGLLFTADSLVYTRPGAVDTGRWSERRAVDSGGGRFFLWHITAAPVTGPPADPLFAGPEFDLQSSEPLRWDRVPADQVPRRLGPTDSSLPYLLGFEAYHTTASTYDIRAWAVPAWAVVPPLWVPFAVYLRRRARGKRGTGFDIIADERPAPPAA
jgi:hypothetical protein